MAKETFVKKRVGEVCLAEVHNGLVRLECTAKSCFDFDLLSFIQIGALFIGCYDGCDLGVEL